MTPLRVGYVLHVFPKISETFVASELAEVCRRGADVQILSLRAPAQDLRHTIVEDSGLTDRTVYDPEKFLESLQKFDPHVLHAHFATEATAAAWRLADQLQVPFTFTAHGYDVYRRPPTDFKDRALAAGAVVTVAAANARHIVNAFGVPEARIHVIPSGVDTERFRPDGPRPKPPHIVCVARLVPVKNLELLLEACALLKRQGLEFHCVLVGDGRCREQLETTRVGLGLQKFVELVGAAEQAEVLAWWRRAAVAVLTSDSEGMPVSLMEAAACGVPAVATAVGGVPELIDDGVTGFLTPPGDAGKLAAALERLLCDPDLVTRFGAAARRRAVEHFSLPRQVDRLLAVWRRLVGEAER